MDRSALESAGDRELAGEIAAHNSGALEEAYRRHASVVYGVAFRVTGSKTLAEDVLQDVFVRLWNKPERFDPGRGTLRAYLLIDGNGRSIEAVRSEQARRNREDRVGRHRPIDPQTVEREVWDRELATHLQGALSTLPDGERESIELAYFGGYTYRQVAEILRQPEGTVKSRIRNGLLRLHDQLCALDVRGGTWDLD